MLLTVSLPSHAIISVLVHATLGIRPPAKKEGQGSDSQDRMHQTAMIAAKD
jgi:hypothetical protein